MIEPVAYITSSGIHNLQEKKPNVIIHSHRNFQSCIALYVDKDIQFLIEENNKLKKDLQKAILNEREECAKVANYMHKLFSNRSHSGRVAAMIENTIKERNITND
jgi:hypothetical protein